MKLDKISRFNAIALNNLLLALMVGKKARVKNNLHIAVCDGVSLEWPTKHTNPSKDSCLKTSFSTF